MEIIKLPLKTKKCCVINCRNVPGRRHRFPKRNKDILMKWINVIKPQNYENLTINEIYSKFYICDEHFTPDCFITGTNRGLKATAIPSLNLPSKCT